MAERWLVMAHEATNSGAPRMLLRVLQGVRAARGAGWSCEILLRRGGALRGEFERFGPVRVLADPRAEGRSWAAGVFRKLIDRPWLQPRRLARVARRWTPGAFDVVYNNTATNGDMVAAARRLGCPLVTHVHELGSFLRRFHTPREIAHTLENTDRFIAVSPAVARDLADLGVKKRSIAVVPNFLPELPRAVAADEAGAIRRRLGLADGTALVLGCGHIHPIKGTDLFVDLAARLGQRGAREVCCVWLGGETDRRFAAELRREVARRGLAKVVRFLGAVDDVTAWLAAADVVAVTSREESFSLVALEAAAAGRPVVGFAAARGLEVLLGETPDLLVDDFTAAAMAQRIEALLVDEAQARRIGGRLRARVADDFLASRRIPEILAVVDEVRRERTAR